MTQVGTDEGLESSALAEGVSVVRSSSTQMIFLRWNQYNFLTDRMWSLKEKEKVKDEPEDFVPRSWREEAAID